MMPNTKIIDSQLRVKYCLNLAFALLLLGPVILILLILGLLLYFDSPGRIFFKQLRLGKNGKNFVIFKLRTMVPGDHTGTTKRNPDGSLALTSDLKGYTRCGKWLAPIQLNMGLLPQLFNILAGR